MSFKTSVQQSAMASKTMPGPVVPVEWVRNPLWMPMPPTTAADEQVDALVAVFPESNYFAVNFSTSAGQYQVDWGDGIIENFTTGVAAQHLYDYSNPNLTDNGLPYKMAMVKVTPTTGGATFNVVNLQVKNTTTGLNAYAQPILDLTISANCTTLTIGGGIVPLRLMERCTILRHNATTMANKFQNCNSLQSVPLFNTSNVTDMSNMFNGCSSLQSVPLFNTAAVTTMSSMFASCTSLQSVPLFNTANVTTMGSMFSGCSLLQSVPLFNTANVTNMNTMFSGCSSLQSVPLFNTTAVTIMNAMFNGCSSLQSVPLFDTSNVTNMGSGSVISSIFANCVSLKSVPLFNTANVTAMTHTFSGCTSLQSVPLFDTSKSQGMASMFANCTSLQSVPLFDTTSVIGSSSITGFSNMFTNCTSLQQIPNINFNVGITAAAGYTTPFSNCPSISKIGDGTPNTGPKLTFTVASCKLSSNSLNLLYTSLPTVTAQTITVSGNVGINADDPTIATAKGWSVTGS